MHAMIIGAAGMLGQKLLKQLLADGHVLRRELTRLSLVDLVAPSAPESSLIVTTHVVDLSDKEEADIVVSSRPDVIFHLAAIVSGEAEADFEKGYRINLDGTRFLFDAIRRESGKGAYCPRLIFASSIAVFGAPFPSLIGDDFFTTPLTSYGTQKAISELLLSDYTRRGFFDGVGLRLPTICIRPGSPNMAASGFFSNILREPLVGNEAVLPVGTSVRHWFASPRSAVGFLIHAANMDTSRIGDRRNLNMPGLSESVGGQIEALRRVAGAKAVALIRNEPDESITRIVEGWPSNFEALRAKSLGFVADVNFDDIIRGHIEDELCG
jgi:D-erythronate 2-dehydrogenase